LTAYDALQNRAVIEYKNAHITIDTSFLDVFQHKINALFQFIGEIEKDDRLGVILKARVIRCVEGLDVNLWEQALELRRKFEKERDTVIYIFK
jgi:CST complex subunit TEN1